MTTLPKPIFHGSKSSYRCGELADWAGISPGDVFDLLAPLAYRYDTDGPELFWSVNTLKDWLRVAAHGREAAAIEITFKGVEWDEIKATLLGERMAVRS